MSQSVEIAILVRGMAGLIEAVAEAGAEWRARRQMKTADGSTVEVEGVAADASGAEVGVQLDRKTGQVKLVPADGARGKGQALAGRIQQRYAYSQVRAELEKKGYRLAREEKQKDGTVRLVMTRWR